MTFVKDDPDTSIDNPGDDDTDHEVLRRQLINLVARNQALQYLLVEVCRKLQISSASIKAAVSSMLAVDFFWDEYSQHEFLETIDDSVDNITNLTKLATLAILSERGEMELALEPHSLPEILAAVSDDLSTLLSNVKLDASPSDDEKPVLVDFEYLRIGLGLLVEGIFQINNNEEGLRLRPVETEHCWHLYIEDIDGTTMQQVWGILDCVEDIVAKDGSLLSESILKIFVAQKLLGLQAIKIAPSEESEKQVSSLQLELPFYMKSEK